MASRKLEAPIDQLAVFQERGVAPLKVVLDPQTIASFSAQSDVLIRDASKIFRPIDVASMPPDLLDKSGEERQSLYLDADQFRLSQELFEQGPSAYRNRVEMVSVRYPFVEVEGLAEIVFREEYLELVSAYLDGEARVSYIKLKQSFVNDLPLVNDQFYHVDDCAGKIVKIIVYLNDVSEEDGPYSYILGSNNTKFTGWENVSLYTAEEMLEHYPSSSEFLATGRAGDGLVTDTKGFHRGTKPLKEDRTAILASYTLEPEYGGQGHRQRIPASVVANFSPRQRDACEFLDIV